MKDIVFKYEEYNIWNIKELLDKKFEYKEFEYKKIKVWIKEVISNEILDIEDYKNSLIVKALVLYEFNNSFKEEEADINFESFHTWLIEQIDLNQFEKKIFKFINKSSDEIWTCSDNFLKDATLKIILKSSGYNNWDGFIENIEPIRSLGYYNFQEIHRILKKVDKNLEYRFIEKLLFPIDFFSGISYQLEICKKVKKSHNNLVEKFEEKLIEELQDDTLTILNGLNKRTILKKILDSNCLSEKSQIIVNSLLKSSEQQMNEKCFDNTGYFLSREEIISSEKYMNEIKDIMNFREKIFKLVYEEHGISWFYIMMFENQMPSILDIGVYNGITNNKYKNSTLMRINKIKSQISVNTEALIKSYENEFWIELNKLVENVEELSGITVYLKDDLEDVRFLINNNKWFVAATFLSQVIERLLRELFFRIKYGVAGFTKDANFALSKLIGNDQDRKSSELSKLFNENELNALSYFLNDRDNGENIRNNLAHYIVNKIDINEEETVFLLDILLFILLKVYYNGMIFEKENEL